MQNTHANTTGHPEVMTPAWGLGLQQAIKIVMAAAARDGDQSTATVGRIIVAANTAGNQPTQAGLKRAWTGDAPLRLWGRACDDLRALLRADKHGRKPPLRTDDVAILAQLPLQLLEASSRLYAEVAPALLDNGNGSNTTEVEARLKLQEFMLNYIITPTVIDLHGGFTRRVVDLGYSCECDGEAEKLIPLIQQVAGFADGLCKLAEQYAPGSNPYAALVADEFTTGHKRIVELAN